MEMVFGRHALDCIRAERKAREECEREFQKHYEEYRRSVAKAAA